MQKTLKLFTALFFLCGAVVSAQTTTGTLVGTIVDKDGGAVSEASVVAVERDTNRRGSGATNSSGNYSIPNLVAGLYTVEIQKAGFKKVIQTGLEVRVSENVRFNATLDVGQLTETVNVQGAPPILQTDTSSIATTITEDQLQRLPMNGRQFETLFILTPGAVNSAPNSHLSNRGGFNIGGVDEHYISSFIDGIDNVDPVIRISSYRPSIEAIKSVRVEASGYGAEFGRNGGAVVNLTTKSGTNFLHGSFWEFLRNDNFDARNFFAPVDFDKPPLIRNQFGGTLGGALKRDRTFFFVAYEGLRQKTGQSHRATVLTERMRAGDLGEIGGPVIPQSEFHQVSREALQGYPLPNLPGIVGNRIEIANKIEDGNDFSVRIDHQLLAGTRLMGRYSTNVTHVLDPFRTETTGISNLSGFGQTADRFRTNVTLGLTTTITPNLLNEFHAGYNRFRQPQIPVNPGTPAQQPLMGFVKAFLVFNLGGSADPLGSNAEFQRTVNVYNYLDSLAYRKGNHQIKMGVDARRYLFNAYNAPPNTFIFTGARAGSPVADFLRGLPTQTLFFDGSPTANTRKFEFAAYAQDDWKVMPRLTLNLGLRWEFYGRIKERVNKQSFWVPDCNCIKRAGIEASEGLVDNDFNNFAPRLGFAWRPVGERTVVRASAGIFYDNDMRHNLEFAINPPFFTVREYLFPPSLSDPFPAAQSSSTLRPGTFDKDFQDTYIEQWNLSLQHEPIRGLLTEIAYVGNHSVKARRLRNVNQAFNGITPYPGFGPISLFEQAGSSNYHALQIRVERRFSRGLGFTSSYTWGHAIDDRPGQGAGRPPNSYNMRAERGDADFDVRHNWASSVSFNLPWASNKPWGRWSVNAISILQGGRPFTVNTTSNGDRPDLVPGVDWKPANQGPDRWINPAAFSVPASGAFGSLGRNTLRGPRLHTFDLSIIKTEYIGDTRLELRAEFFNIFNHPNFNIPNALVGPSLGLISSTAAPERQIQFGVKLGF